MSRNYIGTISQRFYRNEEKQASVCFSCDMCELEKTARVIPTRSDRDNSPSLFSLSFTTLVWPTTI